MERNYKKAFELDRDDTLAHFKNSFVNDERVIYLDGNSLGKLPRKTIDVISNQINIQWGDRLVRSWNENWIALSKKIAKKIAKLVGARDDEIFVGDTTSLNLFKLVFAVLRADPTKHKIISDSVNFPSDLYVIKGMLEHHFKNHILQLIESNDGISLDENALINILDKNTALITLSHVAYKSSFMYDMKRINTLAHKHGSRIIWDLSHSVGAVDVQLNKSNADMAVGCCYKYLNGGPGAPAFLFVKKELQEKLSNPIWSWFSHQTPFDFDPEYKASNDIQKFAVSTPTILSLSAIEPGLDLLLEAGIINVRKKSVMQSRFLLDLIQENLVPLGFTITSPLHDKIRGSHTSIQHPEGYRISKVMIEPQNDSKVIIPDFRPPNNIRLGIAPLYTSYLDLYYCVERIKSIMKNKEYKKFSKDTSGVT